MKHTDPKLKTTVVLVLVASVISTSCSESVATVLSALSSAAATFAQDKVLIETFGQDIKKVSTPHDPAYQTAQKEYTVARAMHERYLDTISLAAITGQPSSTVDEIAEQSRSASAEFLLSATKSLAPRAVTSKISFANLTHTPNNLQHTLYKLPKTYQQKVIDTVNAVRWRTWDEL